MPATLTGIAAIVLAAGRSSRMGGAANKLTEDLGGKPMVRHAVEAALDSGASPVIVVCGHEEPAVRAALAGLHVRFISNPDYAEGLSTSLKAGIAALPEDSDGVVVLLGDMPLVRAAFIRRLVAAFEAEPGGFAAVPIHDGDWGNPVVIARALFADVAGLTGDAGARKLLEQRKDTVIEVPADDSVVLDADTPDALEALRRRQD
jgi:molybdenum cofactor cytidylyltransferase